MRTLSVEEQIMQVFTEMRNREWFISHNTSTMPVFESDYVTPVFPIRYGGSMNMPNTFGL